LNQLKTYFPDDFDIDFNGRALPWEAICIIPFVDEKLFIDHE
jgi:5'-3' exonuclease